MCMMLCLDRTILSSNQAQISKSLRLGAFLQKAQCLFIIQATLSEKPPPDHNHCSTAFHLHPLLFSKSPQCLLFPSSCRWKPGPSPLCRQLVSAEQCRNWMCFPCSRRRVKALNQFIEGRSPMLSPACVLAAMRVIFHLCLISLQQEMQRVLNLQKCSCSRYLKIFCRKENCSHSTHYFFFSSEGISLKRRQSTFAKVKTASLNLSQSLNPFQWEDSQHPSSSPKYRRVSSLRWCQEPSPQNQTTTRV